MTNIKNNRYKPDPAHMQDIFIYAKEDFLRSYSYFTEKDYDNMVTNFFKSNYTKEEMEEDLPLEECYPAVQKAYDYHQIKFHWDMTEQEFERLYLCTKYGFNTNNNTFGYCYAGKLGIEITAYEYITNNYNHEHQVKAEAYFHLIGQNNPDEPNENPEIERNCNEEINYALENSCQDGEAPSFTHFKKLFEEKMRKKIQAEEKLVKKALEPIITKD